MGMTLAASLDLGGSVVIPDMRGFAISFAALFFGGSWLLRLIERSSRLDRYGTGNAARSGEKKKAPAGQARSCVHGGLLVFLF